MYVYTNTLIHTYRPVNDDEEARGDEDQAGAENGSDSDIECDGMFLDVDGSDTEDRDDDVRMSFCEDLGISYVFLFVYFNII